MHTSACSGLPETVEELSDVETMKTERWMEDINDAYFHIYTMVFIARSLLNRQAQTKIFSGAKHTLKKWSMMESR